ncbi:MAG: SsrA-binding protein, partial [Candidatus Pacearchaeota archaeon]|nr:SsrA-binding protein [Candidatus Pacearchaeota archaeon]
MKIFAENKRGAYGYEILERMQAGIVLLGHEVKSVRMGRFQLAGSYVVPTRGELWLVGATIPAYQPKNTPADYDPGRSRKLLVHKRE